MHHAQLFEIDSTVATRFPEIHVGVSVIRDMRVASEDPRLESLKREVIERVRTRLKGQPVTALPRVQGFRRVYKQFGVDPNSRRPSAEALLRRALDPSKNLYTVNTVVDSYNLTSIEYQLPMAAYDLERVVLPITLRFARGGECHLPIGHSEPDTVAAGELVYADQCRILCRDFNYRDADETKVTGATHNLVVFVDGCAEVDRRGLAEALEAVSTRLVALNGGVVDGTWVFPVA